MLRRRNLVVTCLGMLFLLGLNFCVLPLIRLIHATIWQGPSLSNLCPDRNYETTLLRHARQDNVIVLTLTDEAHIDLAVNMYLTSLRRFDIEEYLFVGLGALTCFRLQHRLPELHCATYRRQAELEARGQWRTRVMQHALGFNLTVLMVDVTTVFLRNPIPVLLSQTDDIDIPWDREGLHVGFQFAKASDSSRAIYDYGIGLAGYDPVIDDEKMFLAAINHHTDRHMLSVRALKPTRFKGVSTLPKKRNPKNVFDIDQLGVSFVRGNLTIDESIYVMKECLFWRYDKDEYYSSSHRKYITYTGAHAHDDSPASDKPGDNAVLKGDILALRNVFALGEMLKRIVILHPIYCNAGESESCLLNFRRQISLFDHVFPGQYRETVFLSHPLVPSGVVRSLSAVLALKIPGSHKLDLNNVTTNTTAEYRAISANQAGILRQYGQSEYRVLQFDNLHNVHVQPDNSTEGRKLSTKLQQIDQSLKLVLLNGNLL